MLHAIDCDVHPTVPSVKALLPYLDDFWRDTRAGARHRLARDRHLSAQRPAHRARRNGAARTAEPPPRCRSSPRRSATAGRPAIAICNCLYGVGLLFSEDMASGVCARAQRLGRQGMARPRSAAARLDRDPDAEHRICGGRDRALRQGQALRADPACSPCRRCRSGAGTCGRSMRRPSATACRSASMPARPTGTR